MFVIDYDERNQRTIFVKNIPYTATEESITELFDGCSTVRLPLTEDGRFKG